MILIPSRMVGAVRSCEIFPCFRSDHSYVHLVIDLPFNIPYQRGCWNLTSHTLKIHLYVSKLNPFGLAGNHDEHTTKITLSGGMVEN